VKQFLRIAYRNLISHSGRTLILGSAIALVTALLTLMLALTSGIKTRMTENAMALSTGHLNVGGFMKISQSSSAPIVQHKEKIQELIEKNIPELDFIVDRVRAYGKIISDKHSIMVPMNGVDMSREAKTLGRLEAISGSIADLAKPGHVVIFAAQAKKLEVVVGDLVTISMPTYRNIYNTKDLKVAAILKDLGLLSAFSAFIHHADAREVYDMSAHSTGGIMLYLKSMNDVGGVETRLRKLLTDNGHTLMDKESNPFWMKFERVSGESWVGQRLDVTTWEDEISFLKWILDIFNALTFVLTFVLMFIVVVGLVNNMWMAIRERTAEIGTMRAVGLQRRSVLQLFVFESMMLSVAAVGSGIVLGALIVGLLNVLKISVSSEAFVMFLMSNEIWLNLRTVDIIFVFILLCGLLSFGSLIPAYRASKMKPITAINHVN